MTRAKETKGSDGAVGTTPARRRYRTPVLEPLGDIRDVTLGGSTGVGESGGRRPKTGRGT